jgi:hypothetical protein
MQREMFHDRKYAAKLEAIAAGEEGAGGGDMLGADLDLGAEEGGGELDLGADDPAAGGDEGAGAAGGDEDEVLLAAPGKRDDEPRGPYKSHRTKYRKGGIRKNLKNQATGEYGNTTRSVWKGKSGFGGLDSLARGITEQKSFDTIEEEKLFNTSSEVNNLLESLRKLENKENENKTQ